MSDGGATTARGPGSPGHDERPASGLTTFRRLLRFLKPYRRFFALGIFLFALSALFDVFSLVLLIPFLRTLFGSAVPIPPGGRNAAERALDAVAGNLINAATPLESLRNICLVVLAAILLKNATLYGARVLSVFVQERTERDMRDEVYAHLARLPLGFFTRARAGQLIARVLTDTREARSVISFYLAEVLRHFFTLVAYLVALLALSWRLTLVALFLAPLLTLGLRPIIRRLRHGFRAAYDMQGDLISVLQETVGGIRLVKAYRAEDYERERFEDRSARYASAKFRSVSLSELASPLSETLSAIVALVLLWIGANMVLGSRVMEPEQFVAFITIALRLISPVKSLAVFPARAQAAFAAADRFFEIVDQPPEADGAKEGRHVEEVRDAIRFEDVWFAYEPETPVLRAIDLEVRNGEVVALVGPSGAGKSTLVDLLPRFIEPQRGKITIDGTDLRELSLASLRDLMGIVSQETVIFHDTVRANIGYGNGWSEESIRAAAAAAHADDFIRDLPRGYDTELGDRGVRLSGGQRQRLGLARAVLRDPPILILDEATSALDPESDRLIQSALQGLLAGRTVFIIAHRLSTVQGADRLVVLNAGRVEGVGTHEELYAEGGTYRRFFDLQFAGQRVNAD